MADNVRKTVSLIGFATKAGKLTFGCELTVGNVRKKKKNGVQMMLCASDASDNTKKRVYDCGAYYGIPTVTLPISCAELSRITGKLHAVAVIGVTDDGFRRAIENSLAQET